MMTQSFIPLFVKWHVEKQLSYFKLNWNSYKLGPVVIFGPMVSV